MLKIVKSLVEETKYPLKCPYKMVPQAVVIHNTANDANATSEISYMKHNSLSTSFHYAVDSEQAVQGLPLDRNGWHAGDGENGKGNRQGIAIEICHSLSGGERFEKAQENAAELVARLLIEYGWGMDKSRITKHEDYSSKHCPHRTLDEYGWRFFLNLVEKKHKELMEGEQMNDIEKMEFEKIKLSVAENSAKLKLYEDMGVLDNAAIQWGYIDENLPSWGVATVKKLKEKGLISGDETGNLELSRLMLRVLVILDRAGLFDKKSTD